MFLLRVALPDRPGSLGAIATALGTVGADINAVEIVEKLEGYAIDDFVVELPAGSAPDSLVTACTQVEGVEVLWFAYYPANWGLHADVEVLDDMLATPARAAQTLVERAPAVFRTNWALLADESGRILCRTELAPDEAALPAQCLPLPRRADTAEWPAGWLPRWPETLIATAPVDQGHTIVIARSGGPDFIASELARLRHLAALAHQGEVLAGEA